MVAPSTLRERVVKIGARIVRHGRYHRVPAGRGGGAACPVRRDLAPDWASARAARGGGLTGVSDEAGGARGESHAPRSTNDSKAARIGLRARVQRLFYPETQPPDTPSVDRQSADEQGFEGRPSPSGGYRAIPVKKAMTELSSETRDQLKTVSTATLMSCLFKRGLRNQFIQDVQPLNPAAGPMVGEAFTLRYMPAREDLNPMTVFQDPEHPQRKAVELCPAGAVFVMDSRKDARAASAGRS